MNDFSRGELPQIEQLTGEYAVVEKLDLSSHQAELTEFYLYSAYAVSKSGRGGTVA